MQTKEPYDFHGLPMEVKSEDGETYTIEPFVASIESMNFLWEFVKKHPFLYSDTTRGDFAAFEAYVLSPQSLILLVLKSNGEPVGVLYADAIRPGWDCRGHYLFWDTIQKGRHRVVFTTMRWFMDQFDLHKIRIEVPRFAYSALRRIRRMGLLFEGLDRESILSRGKWRDKLRFGVFEHELTPEAIQRAYLPRGHTRRDWYGLLDSDHILRHAITKRE